MLYGPHFSIEKLNNSEFACNVDLIVPKSGGGNTKLNILIALHIKCNNARNSKDGSNQYLINNEQHCLFFYISTLKIKIQ